MEKIVHSDLKGRLTDIILQTRHRSGLKAELPPLTWRLDVDQGQFLVPFLGPRCRIIKPNAQYRASEEKKTEVSGVVYNVQFIPIGFFRWAGIVFSHFVRLNMGRPHECKISNDPLLFMWPHFQFDLLLSACVWHSARRDQGGRQS